MRLLSTLVAGFVAIPLVKAAMPPSVRTAPLQAGPPIVQQGSLCRPGGSSFADYVLLWVKRTVSDTGQYAASNRTRSALPMSDSSRVTLVADASTCALLAAAFARLAPERAINPVPVYAVAVGSAYYVVTDWKPRAPPPVEKLGGDTIRINSGPSWTDAVTFTSGFAPVRTWKWTYAPTTATPYGSQSGGKD